MQKTALAALVLICVVASVSAQTWNLPGAQAVP
jgi:hypothetical protein